jgi:NAD(P)-dependent dehydrogenase (short-subunit alcohol dehydrogenase family)
MRVALVTGSAKGIGRAILLALAREGFAVAVHYRTSEGLAEATRQEAEALGVRAIKVRADLTREEEVAGLVEEVRYHLGGVGVLVNNVGDYLYKPIEEVSLEEWRWILDTNLTATFLLTQKVLPLMVEQGYGRIVNLGYAGA